MQKENRLRKLNNSIKYNNIHIYMSPPPKLFENIIAEDFSNLLKETDIQIQEAQGNPDETKTNPHQNTL